MPEDAGEVVNPGPDEIDVDALLNEDQGSNFERGDQAPPPPEENPLEQFALTVNGKKIVPKSREDIIKWAQQGYNYSQNAYEFNKQKAEFENQFDHYRKVDDFMKENPDWWDHVRSSYERRDSFGQGTQQPQANQGEGDQSEDAFANSPLFQEMASKLKNLEKATQKWEAFQEHSKQQEEDNAFESEVQSVKGEYQDLDWDSPDEHGKSLYLKVLEHGEKIGVNSFKSAFRDFYHDELVQRAALKAEEKIGKEISKVSKLGILGDEPAPLREIGRQKSIKETSYDDLVNEALKEYGVV